MHRNRMIVLLACALFAGHWAQAADISASQPEAATSGRNGAAAPKQSKDGGGFYSRVLPQKEIEVVDPDGEPPSPPRKPPMKTVSLVPGKETDPVEKEKGAAINLPSTTPDDDTGGQLAIPEITQKARLSHSDVNRIVCREPIKDVFYSEEKGVRVSFAGNNAFVKFKIDKVGDDFRYSNTPTELFIVCGGNTYNVIAVPSSIPSQTIRLENGQATKARDNETLFRDMPAEKKILELIRRASVDDLPESFSVTRENKPVPVFRDLSCTLRRSITVDGEGLSLKEYAVTSFVDAVELSERDFLRREIAIHPIALSFDKLRIGKGETARLFVVEMKAYAAAQEEGGNGVQ